MWRGKKGEQKKADEKKKHYLELSGALKKEGKGNRVIKKIKHEVEKKIKSIYKD